MAIYHPGAFAGNLHGSTKTTTFRRSKTGIIAYDRSDTHQKEPTRANETLSQAKIYFYIAQKLAANLAGIPRLSREASKHGSRYNAFVKALIIGLETYAPFSNVKSELYGKDMTRENVDAWIASVSSFAVFFETVFGISSDNPIITPVNEGTSAVAVAVALDETSTTSKATVTLTKFSSASKRIKINWIALQGGGTVAGSVSASMSSTDTTTTVDISSALASVASVADTKSDWMGKYVVYLSIEVDNTILTMDAANAVVVSSKAFA